MIFLGYKEMPKVPVGKSIKTGLSKQFTDFQERFFKVSLLNIVSQAYLSIYSFIKYVLNVCIGRSYVRDLSLLSYIYPQTWHWNKG